MSDRNDKRNWVSQSTEYLSGFLDALKQQEKQQQDIAEHKAEQDAGITRTNNGVWRQSEHGIPITVTQPHDPAYKLLADGVTSTPSVHRDTCYICEDPEFAAMGMPLCKPCPQCTGDGDEPKGHIPADGQSCDDCGYDAYEAYMLEQEGKAAE